MLLGSHRPGLGPQAFPLCLQAVWSALAIHHLTAPEKQALFAEILRMLRPGGVFMNADQLAWLRAVGFTHANVWFQDFSFNVYTALRPV